MGFFTLLQLCAEDFPYAFVYSRKIFFSGASLSQLVNPYVTLIYAGLLEALHCKNTAGLRCSGTRLQKKINVYLSKEGKEKKKTSQIVGQTK